MRTIYNGGFLPELAIDDDKDSRYWGWLMAKNPADGRWVSLANMSLEITNAVFECEPSETEALRAQVIAMSDFEQAYLKWAMSDAGGQAEEQAFVDLVDAYDAVLKAREVKP